MEKRFQSHDLAICGNPFRHERFFKPDSLLLEDHGSEVRNKERNQTLLCIKIILLVLYIDSDIKDWHCEITRVKQDLTNDTSRWTI